MSDHQHPKWLLDTPAARLFGKVLRPLAELGLLAALMGFADAPWWLFAIVGLMSLPYLGLRFRDVREQWNS